MHVVRSIHLFGRSNCKSNKGRISNKETAFSSEAGERTKEEEGRKGKKLGRPRDCVAFPVATTTTEQKEKEEELHYYSLKSPPLPFFFFSLA